MEGGRGRGGRGAAWRLGIHWRPQQTLHFQGVEEGEQGARGGEGHGSSLGEEGGGERVGRPFGISLTPTAGSADNWFISTMNLQF